MKRRIKSSYDPRENSQEMYIHNLIESLEYELSENPLDGVEWTKVMYSASPDGRSSIMIVIATDRVDGGYSCISVNCPIYELTQDEDEIYQDVEMIVEDYIKPVLKDG